LRGSLDEVAYYDVALSSGKLTQHFLADPPAGDVTYSAPSSSTGGDVAAPADDRAAKSKAARAKAKAKAKARARAKARAMKRAKARAKAKAKAKALAKAKAKRKHH
jgi:hypothetical protein